MRVATKCLKLESHSFHYKVALYHNYLPIKFDDDIQGGPLIWGLKIGWGGFQLRCEIELRSKLITNRKSWQKGFRLDKSIALSDLEYKGATVGYCQFSRLLVPKSSFI